MCGDNRRYEIICNIDGKNWSSVPYKKKKAEVVVADDLGLRVDSRKATLAALNPKWDCAYYESPAWVSDPTKDCEKMDCATCAWNDGYFK